MKFKNLRINSFSPLWWFYILLQLASIIVIKLTVVKVKLFLCNANSTHLGTNCQPPFSGNQKCSSPPDSLYNSLYVYICES